MARGQRYGRPLSLMMFDLDHFKQVNDTHGHLAGDHVLRELAQSVRSKVRKEECLARYGGEEFALVSPESGPQRVRKFAEKLRQIVETSRIRVRRQADPRHHFGRDCGHDTGDDRTFPVHQGGGREPLPREEAGTKPGRRLSGGWAPAAQPFSSGFPAFFQPAMPSGITKAFL